MKGERNNKAEILQKEKIKLKERNKSIITQLQIDVIYI